MVYVFLKVAILLLQIYTSGYRSFNDRLQSLLDSYQRNNASAILPLRSC
jgi:hypothetical protein